MSTTKIASPNKYLLGAGALGTLGALYGMGDEDHNYANKLIHNATAQRASQGVLSGMSGVGGYNVMRGLGAGRVASGLAALLSAGGAAALSNPELKNENPYKLPF